MKKITIILFVLILGLGVFLFTGRYRIVQYSAEKAILSALPDYLKIEKIDFDLRKNTITARNIRIANPAGFSENPFLYIESIICRYALRSANPLDGIDITEIRADKAVLRIERLKDGRTNIDEMKEATQDAPHAPQANTVRTDRKIGPYVMGSKKPADLIKTPDAINIADGRIIFTDKAIHDTPYLLTFDGINADVWLKLNEYFSEVLYLSSTGAGRINGASDQALSWVISLTPTTPKLTMSNRFKVTRADIMPFQPYFLKYSPFVFSSGRFSGELIFDFDNGNIGSTNTVTLEGLSFAVRNGYESASIWQTTVPDLMKYLTTQGGAVVFDFKIKGPMSEPKFYLGPITKRAMTSMAVDKIGGAISRVTENEGGKSDIEKAKEVVDLFKGFIKKD